MIKTALSEAKKRTNKKWNKANMAYQSVTVRIEVLEAFKAACAANGDKVNTVLREAIERYITDHPLPAAADQNLSEREC